MSAASWCARLVLAGLALVLAGCAALPAPTPMPKSFADAAGPTTPLGRIAAVGAPPASQSLSGLRLLPEGPSAFNARIALARRATRSIDAQYYILQDDPVGLAFLRELRDAAGRGVRVRLLVDDLYTAGKDDLFALLAAQPNFELRLFNPLAVRSGPQALRLALSLGDARRVNRRMHNKLFVVDNSFAITGGRNIADEYFMRSDRANFIDMDVLAAGPVVPELSATFDDYWNSAQVRVLGSMVMLPADTPVNRERLDRLLHGAVAALPEPAVDALGQTPVTTELDAGRIAWIWGDARVLADTPKKITIEDAEASFADSVTQRTVAAMWGASSEVVMVSPYFIPGNDGVALMKEGVERGVRMIVITNALDATDESLVYAGYARYRLRMLKAGVKMYELGAKLATRDKQLGDFRSSSGRLHAKLAMVDRRRLFIGSMNLDGRSARLNTEVGLLVDSPALAAQFDKLIPLRSLGAYALELDATGQHVQWIEYEPDGSSKTLSAEPGASWLGGLKDWLLLMLLPEDML